MRDQNTTEASRLASPTPKALSTQLGQPTRQPGWGRRNRRWLIPAGAVVLVLAVVAVAFTFWRTDEVAVRPGKVLEVPSLIAVTGAEVYPPQNEVSLVTVLVSQRLNIWQRIAAQFESGTDIEPERTFTGDGTRSELRQRNQNQMRTSHRAAAVAALAHLGYEIPTLTSGLIVLDTTSASPAARLLRSSDVIVGAQGHSVRSLEELSDVLAQHNPGEMVTLQVQRTLELTEHPESTTPPQENTQEEITLEVELIESDTGPQRALLGVGVTERVADVELPVAVDVDSGSIGGPSAGLALSLGIIDLLTPGDLMGGLHVAATGSISPDGSVGAIGEVDQKTIAAQRAGMDIFLVPHENLAEALHHAANGMKVVGVASLQEALGALAQG
ncbi:MAG: PDZ domain-containing protein [bacterium]|nr:PDZ domain-containing protein [bacterium]